MKITNEVVDRLAGLAKLKFEGQEKEDIRKDLENILEMCEKLQSVNTENIEPLIYMTESHSVLRNDNIVQEISHEEAMLNAPKKDSDFFRVPKVIENNE